VAPELGEHLAELAQRALQRHRKALAGVGRTRRLSDYLCASLGTLLPSWRLTEPVGIPQLRAASAPHLLGTVRLGALYAQLALRAVRSEQPIALTWAFADPASATPSAPADPASATPSIPGAEDPAAHRWLVALLANLWIDSTLTSALPTLTRDAAGWALVAQAYHEGALVAQAYHEGEAPSGAPRAAVSQGDNPAHKAQGPLQPGVSQARHLVASLQRLLASPLERQLAAASQLAERCFVVVECIEAWNALCAKLPEAGAAWGSGVRIIPVVLCDPEDGPTWQVRLGQAGWQALLVEHGFGFEARLYAALEWTTDDSLQTLAGGEAASISPLAQPTALVLALPANLGVPAEVVQALTPSTSGAVPPQERAAQIEAWLQAYHPEKLLAEEAVPTTWQRDAQQEVGRASRLGRPFGRPLGATLLSQLEGVR
jgi:hypothetical protein